MQVPFTEYEVTAKHLVLLVSFITGFHYNVENIYKSFAESKDKVYVLCCLVPYA